jgi:hypothetical protein
MVPMVGTMVLVSTYTCTMVRRTRVLRTIGTCIQELVWQYSPNGTRVRTRVVAGLRCVDLAGQVRRVEDALAFGWTLQYMTSRFAAGLALFQSESCDITL